MASTNTALFFGFLVFWNVVALITGLVSADLLLATTDGDVNQALDDVQSEAGFFSIVFVWIANFLFDTIGFDGLGLVYLGFAALPEWLNLMLFLPMVFMLVFALVVLLIPAVG